MASAAEIIAESPDLQALVAEGFEIDIRSGRLLVSNVPYLNSECRVVRGTLILPLNTPTGNKAAPPGDHTAHFAGEYPHYADKTPLSGIVHSQGTFPLGDGIVAKIYFSSRPGSPDVDNYAKVVRYADVLGDQARVIEPTADARTGRIVETSPDTSPLVFLDANSARAQISEISDRLKGQKIAIVGLGGTGAYVLDFVAKTPVQEIHLFDADKFALYNSYRAPGAPSGEELRARMKKVEYLKSIYSKMHRGITAHPERVTAANVGQFRGLNFVFICAEPSDDKKALVQFLVEDGIPFVDTGLGIEKASGKLIGIVNLISVTHAYKSHIEKIPVKTPGENALYDTNIQIAELNALNAAFAVIKWKKILGFYHDDCRENESAYTLNEQSIANDEFGP